MKINFAVLVVCVGLWVLLPTSTVGFDADIDATVYIYNETTSVEISCGGIPRIAIAIEWKIKKMDGWKRILKINSSGHPKYKEEYSADKYGISESTQTSLVVKNIDYSTFVPQLFRCETLGDSLPYSYTTLLVVTDFEVKATTIKMTKVQPSVEEGSEAKYICETGYTYPYPPAVQWLVGEEHVDANDTHIKENYSSTGNYRQMTKSVLRLTAKREFNKKEVKCLLGNNGTTLDKDNLTVIFQPDGLDMDIGNAVKEKSEISVECNANSSNPASEVDMRLYVDGNRKVHGTVIHRTQAPGPYNGMVEIFVFTFLTDRNLDGKKAKCSLYWKGTYTHKKKEDNLNITYPPEVSLEGTTTPVVEYTERNITCRTNGGNPSDPSSYNYSWIYKPKYGSTTTYMPLPSGSAVVNSGKSLLLKDLSYKAMAGNYKCTVIGIGGQNSGNSVLEVYYAAKAENTKDLIVYAALGSDAILTVKFQMNPVSNYTIHWSMDELMLPNTNVKNTYNGEHVQTSYIISGVTKEHLGNYTVQIINWAIATEDNEVSFNLELKMGDNGTQKITLICMGIFLGLMVIVTLITGYAWWNMRKNKQGKSNTRKQSLQEYDGLNMEDRQGPGNATGVYHDLLRPKEGRSYEGGYETIPETVFSVTAAIESDYLEPVASKPRMSQ